MPVRTKRIYEPPSHGDGYRVLIDGLWPRGITRERDSEHSNATVLRDVLRRGLR